MPMPPLHCWGDEDASPPPRIWKMIEAGLEAGSRIKSLLLWPSSCPWRMIGRNDRIDRISLTNRPLLDSSVRITTGTYAALRQKESFDGLSRGPAQAHQAVGDHCGDGQGARAQTGRPKRDRPRRRRARF